MPRRSAHHEAALAAPPDGLGRALRGARKARGLSLAEVAAATGISRSLLSLIETGRSDVTIGRLMRLAQLYGLHVHDFLGEPEHNEELAVVRGDEGVHIVFPDEGVDLQLLTPDGGSRALMGILTEIEPGGGALDPMSHEGEEFVHVLEGRIRLEVEGSEPVVLEAGDTAHYRSARPHRMQNVGDGIARTIVAGTPPQF